MLRTIVSLFTLIFLLAGAPPAEAKGAVAYVDVKRAIEGTKHWKDVMASLEKERAKRQGEIEKQQAALQERKEKLDAKKALVDPATLVNDEEKLVADAQKLSQAFRKSQQELTALEKKATDQMYRRVNALVQKVGMENDLTYIFEAGPELTPNVIYADKRVDITKQVVELYKKTYKGKAIQLNSK